MSNHKTTDEEFTEAVKTCFSIREVLHKINVVGQGGSYKTFHRRVKKLNLDISHFKRNDDKTIRKNLTVETIVQICKDNISRQSALFNLGLNPETGSNVSWIEKKIIQLNIDTSHWLGQGHLKGKTHAWSKSIPFEEILIEESDYTATPRLKERLVKAGLLEYICSNCGIFEWMGSKLSLHLDHINGVNTDNRLENLRLLCPNCHSITPTYCRGAKGLISQTSEEPKSKELEPVPQPEKSRTQNTQKNCANCQAPISRDAIHCKSCASMLRQTTKIEWLELPELIKEIQNSNYFALSKKLGVSDNAIRKHLRSRGIDPKTLLPSRTGGI